MILRRSRPYRCWPVAPLAALALALAGCLGTHAPRRSPVERLPPDSLALLREALRHARPGYRTQAEALRADTYQRAAPPTPPLATPAPTAAPTGAVVVQISAHREPGAADAAAREAERHFPGWPVRVETAGEVYRVSLGPWGTEAEAGAELTRIRALYPGAWLRRVTPP